MFGIEPRDHVEDQMALRGRHAGCRLVEQQQLRPLRQRDGDLDQPLPAIGQFAHRPAGVGDERERLQMIERFLDDRGFAAGRSPETIAGAGSLADGEIDVFQHGEVAKQLVDLEGAGDAAARAGRLRQRGDLLAVEQHVAGRGPHPAGDQIDESRLAGAVRPDQRVPGAARQGEIDVVGDLDGAEILSQVANCRSAGGGHGCAPPATAAGARLRSLANVPRRTTSTTTISNKPDAELPEFRARFRQFVLQHHVEDGADKRAVQPAGAAEDQHHQHRGRLVEVEHAERHQRVGLGEQRAGDAGERRRRSCKRPPAADAPASRARACGRRFRGCRPALARTANRRSGVRRKSTISSTTRQYR